MRDSYESVHIPDSSAEALEAIDACLARFKADKTRSVFEDAVDGLKLGELLATLIGAKSIIASRTARACADTA